MKKKSRIASYRINELNNKVRTKREFAIEDASEFLSKANHLREPHRHDHYGIFVIQKGNGTKTIDINEIPIKANRIFFLSPGQIHSWNNKGQISGFVILFNKDFFSISNSGRELQEFPFFSVYDTHPYIDLDKKNEPLLLQILKSIKAEVQKSDRHSHPIIHSYLNILLFLMLRFYEKQKPKSISMKNLPAAKIREFEKAVNKHFLTKRFVSDYAHMLHVTPNYLNALCAKIKNKPAGSIIRERILLEAKRLLAHSDNSVSEIAYQLKFVDNSYFGRFFKKYSRVTPAQYRKKSIA